jgi:hypothetical protein
VLSFVFKTAFEAVHEAREWQVVQEERNRVRVRLELLPGQDLDLAKPRRLLEEQFDSLGLRGVLEVDVEVVGRLGPDEATGKLRRIVSRVGPPADLEASFAAAPA